MEAPPPVEPALELILEFARTEHAGDPFAFRFASQSYLVRSAGGGFHNATLAWDSCILADLSLLQKPNCDPALRQRIGGFLRSFLLTADWAANEVVLREALRTGRAVLLTIRSAAAELYALPWELLTLGATGQHLGEIEQVLLRYEWPETETIPAEPLSFIEGGRLLFAWSAAAGAVPAAEQLRAITAASAGVFSFDAQRDVLPQASLSRLRAALLQANAEGAPIVALHLLCHGGAMGSTFGLALDGEPDSDGGLVDAGRLRQVLRPFAGTLRLVVLSACDSGNSGELGNQLGSVAQALHRVGFAAVVASRYPLSVAGSIELTTVIFQHLLGGPTSLETALGAARTRLLQDPGSGDWASIQVYARLADGTDTRPLVFRPYRGLLAFEPAHRRFFFGRSQETRAILKNLDALRSAGRPRLLIVAGASGTGKSSLVLAGAVPERQQAGARVLRLRPGSAPGEALDRVLAAPPQDRERLLLVVDQLEELFTHTDNAEARQQFARRLFALASAADGAVEVIVTLRVDFIGRCGELVLDAQGTRLDRLAYDEAHRVFISQLGPEALAEVIREPARAVGLELEPGLVERIREDVAAEPGALPLLEYTLDRLWQRRKGRALRLVEYEALGGVAGALHRHADTLIDELSPAEQALARRLLGRLGRLGEEGAPGTRRRLPVALLRPSGADAGFDRVLAKLLAARLLVCEGEGAEQKVEVAHEALLRRWPRLLGWLREDRALLLDQERLDGWIAERDKFGVLLAGDQLGYALSVERERPTALSDAARALIRDSRRRRMLRRVAVAVAVGLVLCGLLAFAVRESFTAESQRQRLLDTYVEEGRRLLIEERSPVLALMKLQVAHRVGSQNPMLPYLLADAVQPLDQLQRSFRTGPLTAAALSPDGTRVLIATNGRAELWRVADGTRLRVVQRPNWVQAVAFSPDGQHSALGGRGMVEIFRSDDLASDGAKPMMTLRGPQELGSKIAFSPAGTHLVTDGGEGPAQIWRLADGTRERTLPTGPEGASSVDWSPDGTRVVLAGRDGTVRLFGATDPALDRQPEDRHVGTIWSVAFSPDGKQLATGGEDRTVRLWSVDGNSSRILSGHRNSVLTVAFAPNGPWLFSGSGDHAIRIWHTGPYASQPLIATLEGHHSNVNSITLSRKGPLLLAGSADGTLRLWRMQLPFRQTAKWQAAEGLITAVALSGDRAVVLDASKDGIPTVWNVSERKVHARLTGHAQFATSVALSPDGEQVLTGSRDGTARLWRLRDGSPLGAPLASTPANDGQPGGVGNVAFSPDGGLLLLGNLVTGVRLWRLHEGGPMLLQSFPPEPHSHGTLSRGGEVVLTESTRGLHLFRAPSYAEVSKDGVAQLALHRVALSPDGQFLVGSADKDLSVAALHRVSNGRRVAVLEGHRFPILSTVFSPDGRRILTVSDDGTARLFATAGGHPLLTLGEARENVSTAAFSADGSQVVTGHQDGSVQIWNIGPLRRTPAELDEALRCRFSREFAGSLYGAGPPDPMCGHGSAAAPGRTP